MAALIFVGGGSGCAKQDVSCRSDELIDLESEATSQSSSGSTAFVDSAPALTKLNDGDNQFGAISPEQWDIFCKAQESKAEEQPTKPVSEESSLLLEGDAGGASAQPNLMPEMLKQILQKQTEQDEKMKKLQAENERLKAQQKTAGNTASDNPLGALLGQLANCGEVKKWGALVRKQEKEKPNADFLSNVMSVALNGGITQDGKTVNEMFQGQQAETQGAAAAPSQPASSQDLKVFVQRLFGSSSKTDRSATDKATDKALVFLKKF
ncbi:MAG: hypothetical protein ACPG7U_01100 [Holosporaceae bacterium]